MTRPRNRVQEIEQKAKEAEQEFGMKFLVNSIKGDKQRNSKCPVRRVMVRNSGTLPSTIHMSQWWTLAGRLLGRECLVPPTCTCSRDPGPLELRRARQRRKKNVNPVKCRRHGHGEAAGLALSAGSRRIQRWGSTRCAPIGRGEEATARFCCGPIDEKPQAPCRALQKFILGVRTAKRV